jgi:CBS domain-containing protein
MRRMSVEDVMTPDPVTVTPTTPLSRATRLLADERFGALPVVDEKKRVVGILSTVDVFREMAHQPR